MTIQTIPFFAILPPATNPRTVFDAAGIEGLAASIKADGLLQNLVVTSVPGEELCYRIVSGERRYRALQRLVDRGDLAGDFPVPVEIRAELSAEDTLRLATVENVQRENLTPLEEAAAFAALIQHGTPIDEVSAQTGIGVTTIKRRLAIAGLCDEAKQALARSELSLAQAESLTLGTHDAQRAVLERLGDGYHYDAEDIRGILLERKPTAAIALFPLSDYQGTFTTDLFAEAAATYFDDVEQFFALQRQAVAELAERYAQDVAWVEVTEHYHIPRWHYRAAAEGEAGGVVINLSPTGEVEVLDGLIRHPIDPDTADATADTPVVPAKPRPAYSAPLCRDLAYHKSLAVQHLLLAHPRKAKEVAVLLLCGASDASKASICLTPHDGLRVFAKADEPPASYQAIEQQARRFAAALALGDDPQGRPAWTHLLCGRKRPLALYETLTALSDEELDQLHTLLTVLCFGQGNCDHLDTGDTLFNRVARDLDADMRAYWQPDTKFLSRRTREQLAQIIVESGLTALIGHPSAMKKAELVKTLDRHFQRVHDLDLLSDTDRKIRDWLPDALRFPAVDPAVAAEEPGEEEERREDLAA